MARASGPAPGRSRGRRPRTSTMIRVLSSRRAGQASVKVRKKAKKKAEPRCEAMTGDGGRCKHPAKPGEHVCAYHLTRRKLGDRRKW